MAAAIALADPGAPGHAGEPRSAARGDGPTGPMGRALTVAEAYAGGRSAGPARPPVLGAEVAPER